MGVSEPASLGSDFRFGVDSPAAFRIRNLNSASRSSELRCEPDALGSLTCCSLAGLLLAFRERGVNSEGEATAELPEVRALRLIRVLLD